MVILDIIKIKEEEMIRPPENVAHHSGYIETGDDTEIR